MIKSKWFARRKYRLTSTKHGKSATVMSFPKYWILTYDINGRKKAFTHYHEILEHLTRAGW